MIDVKVFSRKGIDKDSRTVLIEDEEAARIRKDINDEIEIVKSETGKRMRSLLSGGVVSKSVKIGRRDFKKSGVLEDGLLEGLSVKDMAEIPVKDIDLNELRGLEEGSKKRIGALKALMKEKIDQLQKGDELSPGVIKLVKVFLAMKRKLQVGDKMAGRHGNKGVVSTIVPEEDMPYMEDGTSIEIILNPLGVPSRMNVGQILAVSYTHLTLPTKRIV